MSRIFLVGITLVVLGCAEAEWLVHTKPASAGNPDPPAPLHLCGFSNGGEFNPQFDLLAQDLKAQGSPLSIEAVGGLSDSRGCDAMVEIGAETGWGLTHYERKVSVILPGSSVTVFETAMSYTANPQIHWAFDVAIDAFARKVTPGSRIVETIRAAGKPSGSISQPGILDSGVDAPAYKGKERPEDLALVVGIQDYPGLPPAANAERDAMAFANHLVALGVPQRNVITLAGTKATHGQLAAYLREWLPKNATPSSRVFFYFSGHGAPDPQTGQAYLVPVDGEPKFLESTGYPLKELYRDLSKLKAGHVFVVLDACFSGAGGRSVIVQGARPLVTKTEELSPGGGITVLAAAQGDEITGSLDEQRHGLFTFYLLKGLSEGKRSARDLFEYLSPRVQDAAL